MRVLPLLLLVLLLMACSPRAERLPDQRPKILQLLEQARDSTPSAAVPVLREALQLSQAQAADSLTLVLLSRLSIAYYRSQTTDSIIPTYRRYLNKAVVLNDSTHVARAHFSLGTRYFNTTVYDQAYEHFNTARAIFSLQNDSLDVGKSILNLAIIESAVGDFYTSEATAYEALQYLKGPKGQKYHQRVYNNLANIAVHLKKHDEALEWYLKLRPLIKHVPHAMILRNNVGFVYRETKAYTKAIAEFDSVLTHGAIKKHPRIYAMTMNNKGYTYFLQGDERALPLLREAYRLRKRHAFSGELSSLWHLGDYFRKHDRDSAQHYFELAFALSRKTRNVEMHRKTLRSLAEMDLTEDYSTQLRNLEDSLQQHRVDVRYRFARLRHKLDKQEQRNAWLAEAFREEQLEAQLLENEKQFYSLLSLGLFLLLAFLLLIFRIYSRYQEQLVNMATMKSEYSERKRIAVYLHDAVASELMLALQTADSLLKQFPTPSMRTLMRRLTKGYDLVRKVAQKENPHMSTIYSLEKRLSFLVFDLEHSKKIALSIKGEGKIDWSPLGKEKLSSLFYVCSEALVNVYKHSKATKAGIIYTQDAQGTGICIWDNGIGIKQHASQGMGLDSMRSRTYGLGGKLSIQLRKGGGTIIQILLP